VWIYQHKVTVYLTFELYLDDPQGSNANCWDKTVISGLHWSTSDWYGQLITVGGIGSVGDDFSQVGIGLLCNCGVKKTLHRPHCPLHIRGRKMDLTCVNIKTGIKAFKIINFSSVLSQCFVHFIEVTKLHVYYIHTSCGLTEVTTDITDRN